MLTFRGVSSPDEEHNAVLTSLVLLRRGVYKRIQEAPLTEKIPGVGRRQ